MRRIRARRAIAKVLLANPNGITASEIIDKLDANITRQSITDARHVSNLLKGAKGVTKIPKGGKIQTAVLSEQGQTFSTSYSVALYEVSDAKALEKWVA
tara:strand:+ start:658 stop:954 length:297 start_codon:yes stop_codon:yes gene_type:complete